MADNFHIGLLYGPQGPVTKRWKDPTWGPQLEEAFDGKDDEGFVEKTKIMGKYASAAAGFATIADVVMYNNKGGLPVALTRIKYHYVPWLGSVLAYQSAVLMSANVRGKTDQHNHFFGGLAAGAVIGKHVRSLYAGLFSGFMIGCIGWYYKDSRMNNYHLWPETNGEQMALPREIGHPFSHKSDFTMVKNRLGDRPGYWARTPEDVPKVFKQGQLGDGNTTDRWW